MTALDKSLANRMVLSDERAAHFIRESNLIEGYGYSMGTTLEAWTQGSSNVLELDGHVKALDFMCHSTRWLLSQKLSFSKLEQLHKILMEDLLPLDKQGFRKIQVWIGGTFFRKTCPAPYEIRTKLRKWFEKVNSMEDPTVDEVWQSHLAFEHIHPFVDGNGRIGRLLWLWLRHKHKLGYGVVLDVTKNEFYYAACDKFSWDQWVKTK